MTPEKQSIRHRIMTTRQLRAAPDDDHHGIPLPPESPIDATATFVGAETTVDPRQRLLSRLPCVEQAGLSAMAAAMNSIHTVVR
jgi:hypothetical protein